MVNTPNDKKAFLFIFLAVLERSTLTLSVKKNSETPKKKVVNIFTRWKCNKIRIFQLIALAHILS